MENNKLKTKHEWVWTLNGVEYPRKSFRRFLKETRHYSMTADPYVCVPKKLIVDKSLTPTERLLWIVLAGFLLNPETGAIFPGRKRLARLIGVKSPNRISDLTKSLKKKGFLVKEWGKNGIRKYIPVYDPYADESAFFPGCVFDSDDE